MVAQEKDKKIKVFAVVSSQKMEFASPLKGFLNYIQDLYNDTLFSFKIIPLLKKKMRENSELIVYALDSKSESMLKKNNIPFASKKRLTEVIFDENIFKDTSSLIGNMPSFLERCSPAVNYRGINLWDLNAEDLWKFLFYQRLKFTHYARQYISEIKPDEVLIFDSNDIYNNILRVVALNSSKIIRKKIKIVDKTGIVSKLRHIIESVVIGNAERLFMPKELLGLKCRKEDKINKGAEGKKKKVLVSLDLLFHSKIIGWLKMLSKKKGVIFVGLKEKDSIFSEICQYRSLSSYCAKDILKAVKNHKKLLRKSFKALGRKKDFLDNFEYKGIPLWEIMEDGLKYIYYMRFLQSVITIELMMQALAEERPSVAVTIDDRQPFCRTLLRVAKKMKVPTVTVQHGMFINFPINVFNEPIADRMAVYGEESKDLLVKKGYPESVFEITGQPEEIPSFSQKTKDEIFSELRIPRNKKLMVLASQPLPDSINEPAFDAIYKVMKRFPDIFFVSKPHPRDSDMLHLKMKKKYGLDNVAIRRDLDLNRLLYSCDAVITLYSTAGMEALKFGKPSVYVNVNKLPSYTFPKEKKGAVFYAEKEEEIFDSINKIIKNPGDKNKIIEAGSYYIAHSGDDACSRVVSVIEDAIKKGED